MNRSGRIETTDEQRRSPPQTDRNDVRAAAQRWVTEHGDALWRFVLARARKSDIAEEIVQETFLAAIQHYASYSGQSSERTWLLSIATHKMADHFRRSSRATHEESTAADDRPCSCDKCRLLFTRFGKWRRIPDVWVEDPGASIDRETLKNALNSCIDALPPGQREAVWMRDLLDVSTDEVCKELAISATNLWTRLHRARSALRTCMERLLGRSTAKKP